MKKLKIALLCGGPSLERGISLNSARSVSDHLQSETVEVCPVYFDHKKNAYKISRSQLVSNTPSDFDFKLSQSATPLNEAEFRRFLKSVDIAFPVMHGAFGEDGQIQKILERHDCHYVGSPADACKKAFDKYESNELIRSKGFFTLPSTVLKAHLDDHKRITHDFFQNHKLRRAIVKPATGGSSIGVYSVSTAEEALEKAQELFSKRVDTRVVIEPFCTGIEFTVIILENHFGLPVAVMPTEIELSYKDHQVFDYRRKYLASRQVTYHCPPRFSDAQVETIQIQAEQLFKVLGMRDFARFDGWLLPDGNIWFSDINPISGMEQNSFLFMQASRIGLGHRSLLKHIVKNACRRQNIPFPPSESSANNRKTMGQKSASQQVVNVLFGGNTAERQVSVMSGTNVWLKLKRSKKVEPHPYLLDTKGQVWKLPYYLALNHTVEEIEASCQSATADEKRLHHLKELVIAKLSLDSETEMEPLFLPEKMTLDEFIDRSDFVFIGLHGGIGEDGTLQKKLESKSKAFNGSGSEASKLCIDKFQTGSVIDKAKIDGVKTAEKMLMSVSELILLNKEKIRLFWNELRIQLGSPSIIVKPQGDGCSAGIARLFSARDLEIYLSFIEKGADFIPEKSIKNQHGIIEMPSEKLNSVLFEQFIETDKVRVIGNDLKWKTKNHWVEITMGILEKEGIYHAMHPSITVAVGNILTLEEKFQGGTGVNITPPPLPYVKASATKKAMARMEKVAECLGIKGYARIDAFMHIKTGELIIIEANTTPGLTPSTAIYHQALCESPPLYPTQFLEKIIENAEK